MPGELNVDRFLNRFLSDSFLNSKDSKVQTGDLSLRTFNQYWNVAK